MKMFKMLIVLLGLLFASQIANAQVKDINSVREKAKNGDAQSQYLLGWCYGTGNAGLSQDYNMAATWLEKSAAQGYEAAQYFLGWCYYYGRGVNKDYSQAVYWYEKAAKQGNTEAASMVKSINNMLAYNKYNIMTTEQNGYSDYDITFEFLQDNGIIDEDAELLLNYIGLDEYEKLLKGKENSVVVVGQSTCAYCIQSKIILNKIAEEKGVEINYLNISYLTEEEGADFEASLD